MKSLLEKIIAEKTRYLSGGSYDESIGKHFVASVLANHSKDEGTSYLSVNISAHDLAPVMFSGCHVGAIHLKKDGSNVPTISVVSQGLTHSLYDTRSLHDENFDHEGNLSAETDFMTSYYSLMAECASLPTELLNQLYDLMEDFHEDHESYITQ